MTDLDAIRDQYPPPKKRPDRYGTVKRHPKYEELYTLQLDQVIELLERMRLVHGTWRDVSAFGRTRLKVLRALRHKKHANGQARKTVSMTVLDRLISGTEVGDLSDFEFFTSDQLVEMGVWEDVDMIAHIPPDADMYGNPREESNDAGV